MGVRWFLRSALPVAIAAASCGAFAQPNIPDPAVPETGGPVYAITQLGNTVYVGGRFLSMGGLRREGLAAFDAVTGEIDPDWTPSVSSDITTSVVSALATDGNRIYVSGSFNLVNGVAPRNGLCALDPVTGEVDPLWDPDILGYVYEVEVIGSRVLVGGLFQEVNSPPVSRESLASFPLADGLTPAIADAWHPGLIGPTNLHPLVRDIEVSGEVVYFGGHFSQAGGLPRNNLAAADLVTGVIDPAWDPNLSQPSSLSPVQTILAEGSHVYVGGYFPQVGGAPSPNPPLERNSLAAFEPANGVNTGRCNPLWNPNLKFLPSPQSPAVLDLLPLDSLLYVSGGFDQIGDPSVVSEPITREGAAAVSLASGSDPAVVSPWSASFTHSRDDPDLHGYPLVMWPSGQGLLVGGDFMMVGDEDHLFFVGFDSSVRVERSGLELR